MNSTRSQGTKNILDVREASKNKVFITQLSGIPYSLRKSHEDFCIYKVLVQQFFVCSYDTVQGVHLSS